VTDFVLEDGTATVVPRGELDLATISPVRDATEAAIDAGARTLVFDLGDVTFLDSSALAVFAQAAQRVERVVLRRPTRIVRQVITSTGLDQVLALEQ